MSYKIRFDFARNRNKFFFVSIAITVLGILSLLIFGLNYGVDFSSGSRFDINVGQSTTKAEAEELLSAAELAPPVLTIGGENNDRVSVRFQDVLTAEQRTSMVGQFEQKFGADNVSMEENTVDAGMAKEFGLHAIYAVLISCIGIAIYVSFRFEWRFALASVISLFHDAFIVISLFSLFRLEVNLPFVAAVLTIIGYSINDTIVIFDRIREDLPKAKVKSFADLQNVVNNSIWSTLTRSINTGLTVIVCALLLFLLGSESIKLFSLAMIIGLISGAYSSICIGSQLWLLLKRSSFKKAQTVKNAG